MTRQAKKLSPNNSNNTQINQTPNAPFEDVTEPPASRKSDNLDETNCDASSKTTTGPLLHPFVDWSQTKTHISLQVNLEQAESVVALVEKGDNGASRLTFSATGRGVHGVHEYSFTLDLYEQVDSSLTCHPIERHVLLLIAKSPSSKPTNWPRLTKRAEKLAWLRVDFTRYLNDCSSSDNSGGEEEEDRQYSVNKQKQEHQQPLQTSQENPDIFNPFNRKLKKSDKMKYDYRKDVSTVDNARNTAKHATNFKKTYLFLYNLVMFIMFLKVFLVLAIKGLSGTGDDDTVKGAARIVKILTFTQLLETIHPVLGLVPGGPLMPFTQVIGRLLVNHFLTEPEVRIGAAPYAHYLFIVWSCIEIFRYSFYALRVFKVNIYPITWCRYTLFMPLYPMGGLCESMVIFATIKHHEPLGTWSLPLPNALNISFSFPLAMKIYTYLFLGPTIYYLMCYMWRQRCKQLKEKDA